MVAAHPLSEEEFRVLAALPFLVPYTEAEIHDLAASARRRSYRRGEIIHHVDDVAGDVFVIIKGFVKNRLTAADGRQLTHSILAPGGFFGMMSVIDHRRRAGDAVAISACELLVIDRDVIAGFLDSHPEANHILLRAHVRALRAMLSLIQDLAFLSVPMRLAKVLLEYAGRHTEQPASDMYIPAHLNQTELAFLVGTSRESVNQWLKHFSRQGWIVFDRRSIRVTDPAGLRSTVA